MTGTTSGRKFEWQLCLVNSSSRFEYEWGCRGISFLGRSFLRACIVLRVWGFRGGTRNVCFTTRRTRCVDLALFRNVRNLRICNYLDDRANFFHSLEWVGWIQVCILLFVYLLYCISETRKWREGNIMKFQGKFLSEFNDYFFFFFCYLADIYIYINKKTWKYSQSFN